MKKIALTLFLFLPCYLFAQQGILNVDRSFGTNGVAAFNFYDDWDNFFASHKYPDGRILMVGRTQDGNAGKRVLAIARMTATGQPDPNFGTQGKVMVDFNGLTNSGIVKAVDPVILSDGSIIIPMTYNTDNQVRRVVLKLRQNGQIDPGFGENGFYVADRVVQDIFGCMVLSDNKILCLGQDAVTITDGLLRGRTSIFRLLPDGKLDTSFNGINPIIHTLYPGTTNTEAPFSMIPNGNEGFFAAGLAAPVGAQFSGLFILKVKTNGKVDSTYGNNGFATIAGNAMPFPVWSPLKIKRARDGGFLMNGQARNTGSNAPFNTAVYRFTPQGGIDRAFGENGVAVMKFPPQGGNFNITAVDLEEDEQNKIWLAHPGKLPDFSYTTYAVSRFLANGSIDSSYHGSGYVITGMPYDGPGQIYLNTDRLPIITGRSGLTGFTTEKDMVAFKVKPAEVSVKPKSINNLQFAPNAVKVGTPIRVALPQPGTYQISWVAINGQTKAIKGHGNEFTLNTSDLSPGIYLINILQGGKHYQGKVWIQ